MEGALGTGEMDANVTDVNATETLVLQPPSPIQRIPLTVLEVEKGTDYFIQLVDQLIIEPETVNPGGAVLAFPKSLVHPVQESFWTDSVLRPAPVKQSVSPSGTDGCYYLHAGQVRAPERTNGKSFIFFSIIDQFNHFKYIISVVFYF